MELLSYSGLTTRAYSKAVCCRTPHTSLRVIQIVRVCTNTRAVNAAQLKCDTQLHCVVLPLHFLEYPLQTVVNMDSPCILNGINIASCTEACLEMVRGIDCFVKWSSVSYANIANSCMANMVRRRSARPVIADEPLGNSSTVIMDLLLGYGVRSTLLRCGLTLSTKHRSTGKNST